MTPCTTLILPLSLANALWAHVEREGPRECVGALGGYRSGDIWQVRAVYPLVNVAIQPESNYLADPAGLIGALRTMRQHDTELVGLYHSHPRGQARPSPTDIREASYDVPYLIAGVPGRELRAFALPSGANVTLVLTPLPDSPADKSLH